MFSHQLIATMQPVVTGQAPITLEISLEQKIKVVPLWRKQIKNRRYYINRKTETTPQTELKGEIRVRTYHDTYHIPKESQQKPKLKESQQKRKPGRRHISSRKRKTR